MKAFAKLFLIWVLAALLIVPAAAQTGSFASPNVPALNVRTQPDISRGAIIARVGPADLLPIVGQSTFGNWFLVDLGNNNQGWVFAHLVDVVNSSGTSAPVVTTTNPATLGQGGGFLPPTTTVVVPPTTTVPIAPVVTTTNPATLGQGGGFLPPTTTSTFITPTFDFFGSPLTLNNLNMRTGPGTEFRLFWRIPSGEAVTILNRNFTGTWLFVNHQGRQGWVSARYVALPRGFDLAAVPVAQ